MTFYLVSVKDKVAFHKGMCERVINKLVNILKDFSRCSLERLIYVYSFLFILVARVVPQSWILSLKTHTHTMLFRGVVVGRSVPGTSVGVQNPAPLYNPLRISFVTDSKPSLYCCAIKPFGHVVSQLSVACAQKSC